MFILITGSYEEIYLKRPTLGAYDVTDTSHAFLLGGTLAYNDTYVHILPSLFNVLSNAVLFQSLPSSSSVVTTTAHSLPSLRDPVTFDASSFSAPFLLGMVMTVVPAAMFIELVLDREIKARNLLRLNGVSFNLYFFSFFTMIFSICLIPYVILLIASQALQVSSLVITPAFINIVLLYLMYLISVMPYLGTVSYLFDKTETARTFLPNMVSTFGILTYLLVSILDMSLPDENVAIIVHCISCIIVPIYIPYGAVYYINKVYITCTLTKTCDDVTMSDYQTTPIIVMYAVCIINTVVYYMTLRVCDAVKNGGSVKDAFITQKDDTKMKSYALLKEDVKECEEEDGDVKEARLKVQRMVEQGGDAAPCPALIYNLGKTYKKSTGRGKYNEY